MLIIFVFLLSGTEKKDVTTFNFIFPGEDVDSVYRRRSEDSIPIEVKCISRESGYLRVSLFSEKPVVFRFIGFYGKKEIRESRGRVIEGGKIYKFPCHLKKGRDLRLIRIQTSTGTLSIRDAG